MSLKGMTLRNFTALVEERLVPGAAVEEVGARGELVIYTGLTVSEAGRIRSLTDTEIFEEV